MFCRPASSRAHVTLIQSFSFNFKSLVDFRNPHWVHWKSPALLFSSLLLVSPPFCLFFFLFLLLSFMSFLSFCLSFPLVITYEWCVEAITPSLRLPADQSVHLLVSSSTATVGLFFCFFVFLPFRNSFDDGSEFCCSRKNTSWSYRWKYKSVMQERRLCALWLWHFFSDVKSDLQFGDFFYWIRPPNICFFIGNGRQETVKEWGEEYKRRGKEERSAQRKKRKRHRWGVFEEEGTGHPAFRARNVLQRCV